MILDWDIAHPLMQYIRDLSLVYVAKASVVELPPGAKSLIDSNQGPLAFIVPREGYTDTVVTFPLMDGTTPNTTWFRYISFPLFILNSIQALGNVREGAGDEVAEPGRPVVLHAETASRDDHGHLGRRTAGRDRARAPPRGRSSSTRPTRPASILAQWEPNGLLPFAVNLFDARESDLAPRGLVPEGAPTSMAEAYKIKIGYNPVTGTQKPPHRPEGHLVVLRAAGAGRACWSSGTSIIGGFISDAPVDRMAIVRTSAGHTVRPVDPIPLHDCLAISPCSGLTPRVRGCSPSAACSTNRLTSGGQP